MPKSKHQVPGRVRSAYEFIKAHRDQYSVQMMCRVLEVAPSGYYEWVLQPVSNRAQEDARLLRLIRASFTASHGIYGAPRVFLDPREAGETCSKHRVARLMREADLRALHGYRTRRWAVQGTQFGSDAWRRFCRSNRLEPSMSRKGSCWDNAVAESFFSSLKKERIKKQIYKNRERAIADVADYIDTFYNRTRRHSHLGGLSSGQFEAAHKTRRQRLH